MLGNIRDGKDINGKIVAWKWVSEYRGVKTREIGIEVNEVVVGRFKE